MVLSRGLQSCRNLAYHLVNTRQELLEQIVQNNRAKTWRYKLVSICDRQNGCYPISLKQGGVKKRPDSPFLISLVYSCYFNITLAEMSQKDIGLYSCFELFLEIQCLTRGCWITKVYEMESLMAIRSLINILTHLCTKLKQTATISNKGNNNMLRVSCLINTMWLFSYFVEIITIWCIEKLIHSYCNHVYKLYQND